jgi:hypothetical protein
MTPPLQTLLVREYAKLRWSLIDDSLVDETTANMTLARAIEELDRLAFDNGLIDPLDPWMIDDRRRFYREAMIEGIRKIAQADSSYKDRTR